MQFLISFLTSTILHYGYLATVLLMAIESCNIPFPSEVILPFSGFLVATAGFSFWGMVLAGAIGCVIGSDISYFIGMWGGKRFLNRYGRYFLISKKDIEISEAWFQKYGDWATLISRVMPVVRSFISIPAGMHRVNFLKFNILTFIGSFIWSLLLVYLGKVMGDNWEIIRGGVEKFAFAIVGLIILAIIYHIYRKVREIRNENSN